jgi:hypothetical protein
MSDDLGSPYYEGFDAAVAGTPREENPYRVSRYDLP